MNLIKSKRRVADHGEANYRQAELGEEYRISGPRRDGLDRLYGKTAIVVESMKMFGKSTGQDSTRNRGRRASLLHGCEMVCGC